MTAEPHAGAPPQRVLILMSDTGGGHRASALALKASFEQQSPAGVVVEIIDLLSDYTFWPLNRSPSIYAHIARELPWLWGVAYSTQRAPALSRRLMRLAARLAERQVSAALDAHNPGLVVSVHPLAQEIALHALRKRRRPTPFATVVTDLADAHPLWLHPDADACFVASREAEEQALRAGVAANRLHTLGLPVRPAFALPPPPRDALRAELAMAPALPAVLIMGGGDGVGPVEAIAAEVDRALTASGAPLGQVVVICGRNEALRERLAARTWGAPAQLLGFVDRMPLWMHACDALITKAGPGTLAEAFICGLPVILSGYIPGQETGNVDYVQAHGAGTFEADPARMAQIVQHWFGAGSDERLRLAAQARSLGKPHATADIVAELTALMAETAGAQ
jgi:1,2-diacylglycerol 3-beta-galactosyltransferase